MLEADSFAVVLSYVLFFCSLPFSALCERDELLLLVSHVFTVHDTFNSVLWGEAVEELINTTILGFNRLCRVFSQDHGVVGKNVLDVNLAHMLGGLGNVSLTDLKHGLGTELGGEDANGSL